MAKRQIQQIGEYFFFTRNIETIDLTSVLKYSVFFFCLTFRLRIKMNSSNAKLNIAKPRDERRVENTRHTNRTGLHNKLLHSRGKK